MVSTCSPAPSLDQVTHLSFLVLSPLDFLDLLEGLIERVEIAFGGI